MIIPRPSRRRGAAASLILGDHPVSSPDSVRHHSSHHLLHPAVPRVVAVTFTTRPAHAHDPVLGVIGECPDPVPDHITARVVAESRPVHARNAVRLYSPHLLQRRILQWIAATHSVPHPRPIPVPVVIKSSRPRPPACRRHQPPDVVIGERLISALPIDRPVDADELTIVAGRRADSPLPRAPPVQSSSRQTKRDDQWAGPKSGVHL